LRVNPDVKVMGNRCTDHVAPRFRTSLMLCG
jgi:hypothetical protein